MSSACNNIKTDSQEVISNVACAMCSKCLISVNLDKYYLTKKAKLAASSNSESQYDCSNGDNACTSNAMELKIKRFPNSTSLLDRLFRFVYGALIRLFQAYDRKSKASHQFHLEVYGNGPLREIVQQTFIQSIFIKWPLHHQSASWLVHLPLSLGYGINVYPTSTSTPSMILPEMTLSPVFQSSSIIRNIFVPLVTKTSSKFEAEITSSSYRFVWTNENCQYKWKAIRFGDCGRLLSLHV
nr:hypothetical protein [Tanacetum cinerariifolium]